MLLTANQAVNAAAFSMLFPLISVRFIDQLELTATVVGIALAMRNLTQHGLTIFGGAIADQIGQKPMIVLGMTLRALGFVVLGLADSAPSLFLGTGLSGLGGMLFDAPSRSALAEFTTPGPPRQRAYALVNSANSLGNVTGPLIGVSLLAVDFRGVGLVSGGLFLLIALQTLLVLPSPPRQDGGNIGARAALTSIRDVARDWRFVRFTAAMTTYWFLYNQLFVTIPLAAVALTADLASPGWMYALSASVGILLQYPMARLVSRRFDAFTAVACGLALTGAGLMFTGLATQLPLMVAGVVVYSFGRFIVEPVQSSLVSELAPQGRSGAYFGFSILAFAIGGSLGNALGGTLYDLSGQLGIPAAAWIVMGAIGLLGAEAMRRLGRSTSTA